MNDYEERSIADTISGILDSILNALVTVQLVYLVLKLTEVINYTWWQVLTPTFVYIGILAVLYIIIGILTVIDNCD